MEKIKIFIEKVLSIFYMLFWLFKIEPKSIVCMNFSGKGYGDSPKYIAEKILTNSPEYKIYWVYSKMMKSDDQFPERIITIKKNSLKYFYCLATSKYWISNNRMNIFIRKRKKQIYIQTWHGGLALKKIEYDAQDKLSRLYTEVMKVDNNKIDYLISNSDFCTKMYRNAFKYKGKILEIGTPRNDILIMNNEEVIEKVRKYYRLKDEKILLYVPTFRNSYDKNPYDINFKLLKNELEKNGEKWKIIIRLHPKINNPQELINDFNSFINGGEYPDIQELICATNLIITDYSSTMFEGMIANKPVILYANDIDLYMNERGYYFSFEELPFEIATTNNELIKVISAEKFTNFSKKYAEFSKNVGLKEYGKASEYIADLILHGKIF